MPNPSHILRLPGSMPLFLVANDAVRVLLKSEDTGGRMALVEVFVPPGGGPPMHVHEREDETFHVLDGELTVVSDGETIKAGAGATVFLPRGHPHRFANESNRAVRMLVTITPGGLEKMFFEVATPVPPGTNFDKRADPLRPEVVEPLVKSCERCGVRFMPPN